jgi:hypothetical protein
VNLAECSLREPLPDVVASLTMIYMRRLNMLVAISFFLLSCSLAFALDDDDARQSLRGLQGVGVLIEKLNPEVEQSGLSSESIQGDVELKLRLAGIRVLSREESLRTRAPILYVNVNMITGPSIGRIMPFSISVAVTQRISLERDSTIRLRVPTWSVDATGTQDASTIRNTIKDFADRFINAYLSVNPK